MTAGQLEHQVTLQSPVKNTNQGEIVKTYIDAAVVWAYIISQRGTEAFESARVNARETLRIRIRYRDDVDNEWRVQWQNRNYNVINCDRSGRRKGELWLTLQAVGAM